MHGPEALVREEYIWEPIDSQFKAAYFTLYGEVEQHSLSSLHAFATVQSETNILSPQIHQRILGTGNVGTFIVGCINVYVRAYPLTKACLKETFLFLIKM